MSAKARYNANIYIASLRLFHLSYAQFYDYAEAIAISDIHDMAKDVAESNAPFFVANDFSNLTDKSNRDLTVILQKRLDVFTKDFAPMLQ